MKTNVTQTSVNAYHGMKNLTLQQRVLLSAIRVMGETCIADLASDLHWEKSTVTGRMNELKKADLITCVGKRVSKTTGISSEFWRITEFKETLF